MTAIIEFDAARARVQSRGWRLKPMNLTSTGLLSGEVNSSLIVQRWIASLSMPPKEEADWREWDADIARLGGISGKLRIGDPMRQRPYYDEIVTRTAATFDDDATFDDGSGWEGGTLPPFCVIDANAYRKQQDLVFRGLPASITGALRPGDLFEIWPNGEPADFGHLYIITRQGNTNSAGKVGVSFVPGLRANVVAGDMIVLRNPKTVMRLSSDDEGEINVDAAHHGRFGLSLTEVLPRL